MKRGKFITLEGAEACGKTTQLKKMAEWLAEKKISAITLREPGGTKLGEAIRHLLKHDSAGRGMCPETELLLFAASRAELARKIIQPALTAGQWVLCDRFHDSTTVYQGMVRGLDKNFVANANQFAIGSCLPDLTLVLEADSGEIRRRRLRRVRPTAKTDRFDDEAESFHRKVAEGFRKLAKKEPKRVHLISADGSKQEVFEKIQKELRYAFPGVLD